MIEFDVPINARPQGSKRHVGHGVMIESAAGVKEYREAVAIFARDAYRKAQHDQPAWPLMGAVSVRVEFYLPAPKRKVRHQPHVKPDIDKLCRSTLDGLTGVAYFDDAQVTYLVASKFYAVGLPMVKISVGQA